MLIPILTGWLAFGAVGWWIMVRYVEKELTTTDLWLGIPISAVMGPMIFVVAVGTLCIKNASCFEPEYKVYRKWKK